MNVLRFSRSFRLTSIFCGALLLSAACSSKEKQSATPESGSPPAAAAHGAGGNAINAGGLTWTVPQGWEVGGERPMRAATYSVPAAKGDAEAGECAVYYFGQGQGGDIQSNLQRWIGQFEQPGGKSSADVAKTAEKTINNLHVTTIELAGTYLASAGPMATKQVNKPGFMLLGAIIEGPQGNVFFKFTGPKQTVTATQKEFQSLIGSVKAQ